VHRFAENSYKMSHLDKTLQVQRSFMPLRAAGFSRALLVGLYVTFSTLTLCPQPTRGETSFLPPNDSTETLTFNYAIANSYPRPATSIETQNSEASTTHNSQQSSILIGQTGETTPGMPGLFTQNDPNQSSAEDLAQTSAPQIQSSDAGKPVAPLSVDVSQESNASQDQRIFLSDENKIEALDTQTQIPINSSTKLRFYPADSSEQRTQVALARFAKVFDQTWEAPHQKKPGTYGTIPLVLNDSVEKNLEYFQYGIHERFQSYLDRFHHYQDLVEPVFHELGLPPELMYLSLVESGFNPRAFSRSRASGPWQFMKGTGRVYGLDVDWYLDERRDPIKSTVAAAHHLRDLYDQFGSWPLALGAYNAGSGKISRAIKKTGTRDFWKIRRSRHIRRETKDYVPRFIAATLIAQNPTAYGFTTPDGDRHEFEEVLITKRVHLSAVTKQTGIPVEELQRLNPELRRSIVPSLTAPGYFLKVPLGMASLVEELHPTLAVWTQPPPPPTEWHTVRRGESLSVVAKRYRMKVSQLKEMNNLRSNIIRVGTKLRVRGEVGDDDADSEITWYRVRSGDSLGSIATRFRISVNSLMRLNNLSSHIIHPGDRLRVKGEPSVSPSNKNNSKWYKVRRGDSLWTIARQFSVSVNDLQALNNLSSSIIQAGRMLMVSQ
jgi:membrane-bound lytic murein transglycosylase D